MGNRPKTSFQEGSHLGRAWNLALRLHFGSDGTKSPSAPGCPRTPPAGLGMWRLHSLGSAAPPQPVPCLSISVLGRPQLPDGIQVPHHHP